MAITKITSNVIEDGGIDTVHIADLNVTTAKIAADAITGAKIADDAIDSEHYTDGSIDTAHIADNQVTLAKMAGITRGSIIIGNASGDPAALGVGSNAQVLKSDGTDISWGTDSGGAALTGSTNNTVVTVTGSDAIQGEANMTFDGTDLTIPSKIVHGGDTDTYMNFPDPNSIRFDTGGKRTFEMVEGVCYLHTVGPTDPSGAAERSYIYHDNGDKALRIGNQFGNDAAYIALETRNTARMTILGSGKIGVGVTDPDCALEVSGTDAMSVPSGTTAQRPTARNGMIRYNTTEDEMEVYTDGSWANVDVTVPPYSVSWLVVAGGGSGGGGNSAGVGGGGAGGYRSSYNSETSGGGAAAESALTFTVGVQYTITVGAGGAGRDDNSGLQGGNSSIAGSGISTITSTGGGAGAHQNSNANQAGGSGGGGAYTGSGGAGTSGQGYAGGTDLYHGSGYYGGGGGGGASAVGEDGQNTPAWHAGAGGAGRASTITGSSVTYAGGGGGAERFGALAGGAGGAGGGGAGAQGDSTADGGAGTANTGGGGGAGAGNTTGIAGGAGGSGVVIVRMPTANYSGTVSGSPTVTTSGSDTIVKFTGSGTITG